MKVEQIYNVVNEVTHEIIGESAVVNADLSNIVDIGATVFASDKVDNYVKAMIDRIGRLIVWDRKYTMSAPNITKSAFEWGAVIGKIRVDLPDAVENKSWELQKGDTPNQFEFNPPTVKVKYFNKKTTFEVDCSFTEIQVKEAFTGVNEFTAFFAGIYNRIETKLTLAIEGLTRLTINNLIANKIHKSNGVVDLLALYNTAKAKELTEANAIYDEDFLRFASYTMYLYFDRIKSMCVLYNVDEYPTYTPDNKINFTVLSNLAHASDVYLQSSTYHNELVKLPNYTVTPFWQGSGTDYSYDECSKIDIKIQSGDTVKHNHIVAVIWDSDCCGIYNDNRRVTSAYNARGEFYNNFYKMDSSYFNDLAENCIIFTIGTGVVS